jgi:putative OPT family oligopeptide transporter
MANFQPYIPADARMPELTFRAVFLGIIMSIVLGAANAYLGLMAGMTVAATFPAAVVAMAVLRLFKGSILEENIARTTGAVGEALAAGAIFTLPAFLISGVWTQFDYLKCTEIMLVGGILGVLFVIILRSTLVKDDTLPFPESVACEKFVKSGQKGASGAGYVFGSVILASIIEFFSNENAFQAIKSFFRLKFRIGKDGDMVVQTPAANPALMAVGYIIGPKYASITFSGGIFGWLVLMPLYLYFKGGLMHLDGINATASNWFDVAKTAYSANIKPIAVGAMLVGAFYTLFNMRKSLISGIGRSVTDLKKAKAGGTEITRTEKDLSFGGVFLAILFLVIPMVWLYQSFTMDWTIAAVAAVVMLFAGFLFAAVAGYLVGTIGSSSNPISGLTLSTLLIAAVLLKALGVQGNSGVAAVLGVAAVVCCIAGVAGDMIQDWKVGHLLGGTPWRMQIAGMFGVVFAGITLVGSLYLLNQYGGGIGSEALPAPQAGLMAQMARGIINNDLPWPLIIVGMLFAIALICTGFQKPMLVAVGMYLPFTSTGAIFVGGLVRWVLDKSVAASYEPKPLAENAPEKDKKAFELAKSAYAFVQEKVENTGTLLASGLIAGQALCGILIAGLVPLQMKYSIKTFCTDHDMMQAAAHKVTCLFGKQPPDLPYWYLNPAVILLVGLVLVYFPYVRAGEIEAPTSPKLDKGKDKDPVKPAETKVEFPGLVLKEAVKEKSEPQKAEAVEGDDGDEEEKEDSQGKRKHRPRKRKK